MPATRTPTALHHPAAMSRTAMRRAQLAFLRGVVVCELTVETAEPCEVPEPEDDDGGPAIH